MVTTVPADLFADLIDGWVGPVETHHTWDEEWYPTWFWSHVDWLDRYNRRGLAGRYPIRLDLGRPECRAQLARVLGRGLDCPKCGGTGEMDDHDTIEHDQRKCVSCLGSGWDRPPAPVRHLVPRAELGDLPDEHSVHSAALLTAHALDIAAGGRGVVGVLGPWVNQTGDAYPKGSRGWGREVVAGERPWPCWVHAPEWRAGTFQWYVGQTHASGSESGHEGRRLADEAALSAGFALIEPDGIRLPVGVPRVE